MNLMDLLIKIGIDDQASTGISKLTSAVGSGLASAAKVGTAAVTAATAAVVSLTKSAVNEYSDYEQLTGGIEAMFGGIEVGADKINTVVATAQTAWKDLTMSQNDYYTTFTSTYPLIKSSIEDENEAIATTNRMLTLESDLSNTFGYSMETASTAINWALKGSFNYLDNLNIGITGTEEGFKAAAEACGYVVDNVKDLTSAQILDVLEQYANQYGVLGKTAEEAGTTIQGASKMVSAAWENMLTALSGGTDDFALDFESAMNDMMTAVFGDGGDTAGILSLIRPVVETVIDNIGVMITQLAPRITELLPGLVDSLLPSLLEGVTTLISGASGVIPSIIQIITDESPTIMEAGFTILSALGNGILENIDQLITAAQEIVMKIVEFLGEHSEEMTEGAIQIILALATGLIEMLPELIEAMPQIIEGIVQGIMDNLPAIITAGGEILLALIEGAMSLIGSLETMTLEITEILINGFKDAANSAKEWGSGLIDNFISGITAAWGKLKAKLDSVASTIKSYLHFSEPDVGPLSDFSTYAPDMIKTFAEGIEKNGYMIGDAFNDTLGIQTSGLSTSTSNPSAGNMTINLTTTLDGAVIAKNQYSYNKRESRLHGMSLVNA